MTDHKLKRPLEKDIQREIMDWLDAQGFFFWRSNNVPVYGRSGRNNAGEFRFRALPKYTPHGLPDVIVIKNGKFIALEVKREGGRLRPAQAQFGLKVQNNGGIYDVVYSLDDVKTLFAYHKLI